MSPFRKVLVVAFISMTIAFFSLSSYIMYLYFGAYDVALSLQVAINNIGIKYSDSTHVSVLTNLTVDNPTSFLLKLVYLEEELYLNGKFLDKNALSYYSNPIELYRNTTISFEIPWVRADKVATGKDWLARIYIIVEGVPLFTGGARFTRFVSYQS